MPSGAARPRTSGYDGVSAAVRSRYRPSRRLTTGHLAASASKQLLRLRPDRRFRRPRADHETSDAAHDMRGWTLPAFDAGQRLFSGAVRCRPATPPLLLVTWGAASYSRVSRRRAEVLVRLAVGDVSDTRTSLTAFDRANLVRSVSAVVLPPRSPDPKSTSRDSTPRFVPRFRVHSLKGWVSCHNV
jgi:hypothetical protein